MGWINTAPDLPLVGDRNGLTLTTGNSIVFNYPSLTTYTLEVGVIESGVSNVYFGATKATDVTKWTYASNNFTITQTGGVVRYIRLWSSVIDSTKQNTVKDNVNYGDAGIIGLWKCQEGYGDILHDSSANNNAGTINGAKWIVPKNTNSVYELQFNGTSDVVTVPNSSSLNLPTAFTLVSDVVLYKLGVNQQFICKTEVQSQNSQYEYSFLVNTTNKLGVLVYGGISQIDTSNFVFSIGQKYRVVSTYSGGTLKMFANGRLLSTTTPTIGSKTTGTGNVTIGKQISAYPLNGRISNVKLYNRALTDTEIKAISNDMPHPTNGLVLDLPMDEGYGYGVVKDRSTYGNDGSINGAVWTLGDRRGLSFNGSSNHITLSTANLPTNTCTIEAKFKTSVIDASQQFILSFGTVTASGAHELGISGSYLVYDRYGGGFNGTTALVANTIYSASISITNNTQNLYLNGVLDASGTQTNSVTLTGFQIGKFFGGSGYWNGNIYEVRIWNRSLSAAEIALYKDMELSGSEPGLVFYFKGRTTPDGKYAIDESKYGNHGAITGATPVAESAQTAKVAVKRGLIL